MKDNLKINTVWNIIGTTINAFSSLFFMIIITRINGIFDAGIFTFAFSTATMFNVIGVYAGRIYQVTDNSNFSNKDFLINRIISCFAMLIVTILFIAVRNYNIEKALVIFLVCLWKLLEAFADSLYGFLQKDNKLYKVGITLTIKNIVGLILFLILDLTTNNMIISIITFIFVYIITLIFYDLKHAKICKVMKEGFNWKNVLKIFIQGFATFCTSFLTMYLINCSKYSIDSLATDDIQAIFGIIIMPATIMILIAQFVIHPFLVIIDNEVKAKRYKELSKILLKIFTFIILIGLIGLLAGHFVGTDILGIVYGINLKEYTNCLDLIIIGAICYALTSVINTVLIAMRHTVIQMIIYLFLSLISIFTSYYLVLYTGIFGASLSYLLIMILNFIIFMITYFVILKREEN